MTGKRNQTTEKLVGDLENLRSDMENADEISDDLFFFPKHRGVHGYWGTGQVWFVGQKPSKGGPSFPDSAVELLYNTLAEFGFHNAHITDMSKERGFVPENGIRHEEVARMRPYFRREVEILQPQHLVAMSRYTESALKYMAITDGIEISYLHHYSWADGRGDKEVFIEGVRSLADRLGMDY